MSTTHISEPTEQNAKSKDGQLLETISLRDYFAAKAMQGDISSMQAHEDPANAAHHIAARAYAVADAMLKAREEGGAA